MLLILLNSIFIMETSIQTNYQNSARPPIRADSGAISSLYEEVINKNFEIFKNILPRINSLFEMNEQLEKCVGSIEKKLSKMESDHQNLHYEMRSNYLAIDSKLNNIMAEHTHMNGETGRIRAQTDQLKKQFYEQRTKNIQKITNRQQEMPESKSKISEKSNRGKRIAFVDQIDQKQEAQNEMINNNCCLNRQKRRSSINISSSSSIKQNKVTFNQSQRQIISSSKIIHLQEEEQKSKIQKSQKILSRKANLKPSRTIGSFKGPDQENIFTQKLIKKDQNEKGDDKVRFQKFLKEMDNYHIHNQKIKMNYQELMAEYCRVQEAKFVDIQSQIKLIQNQISKTTIIPNSANNINYDIQNQLKKLRAYIDAKIQQNMLDHHELKNEIVLMKKDLIEVNNQRKKMAKKDQTKRALQFLEQKINMIIDGDYDHNKLQKTLKTVEIDRFGCFRVNKPTSFIPTQQITPVSTYIETETLSKRQSQSVYTKRLNRKVIQNRFNERLTDWQAKSTETKELSEQSFIRIKNHDNSAFMLKKKSMDILGRQTIKPKPKLKKQRLIFQYD